MRRLFRWASRLIVVFAILATPNLTNSSASPAASWQSKVDAWVQQTAAGGPVEFLVLLQEQADLSAAARLKTKAEKGAYVYETLTRTAARSQAPLLADLQRRGAEYQSFWVANMLWVRGDARLVQALAQRSDVAHLYANPWVKLEEPAEASPLQPEAVDGIEWNISKVRAPEVWAAGYTGQGVVVGGQDTGYQWNHPALIAQYRGWNGATADHNYQWHDAIHENNPSTVAGNPCGFDSLVPCDDNGHGTHTMGTMVGDDGGSNQIGMAPGARWIGCRNMEQGWGKPSTYTECYQWFIAPTDLSGQNPRPDLAPDVINNSWSCPVAEGCSDPNMLKTVVENLRAAGILTAHSAGNTGSSCSTISEPATIYAASFSVGATDSLDNIASYSSRGPVTVDGSNRLKPDVSAPGSGIRSAYITNSYTYLSGTSMAAPHVAGLTALLISTAPQLAGQVDTLESLMELSALPRTTAQTCGGVPGSTVPNNTYGYGRIDALSAYQRIGSLKITKNAQPAVIAPGQWITYTLAITHTGLLSPTHAVVISDVLPSQTSFISATQPYTLSGETVSWGFASLSSGEARQVQLVVAAGPQATGSVVNELYGVRSQELAFTGGPPVSVAVVPYSLALSKYGPEAVAPGETLTYTLRITNPHPTAALHNLVLTDTLPLQTGYLSANPAPQISGDLLTWSLAELPAGSVWNVSLYAQAALTAAGAIENLVYGARTLELPAGVNGSPVVTQVVIPPDFLLTAGQSSTLRPGEAITYTHRLTNTSSLTQTLAVSLTSSLGWASEAVLNLPPTIDLGPWQAAVIPIRVQAPPDAQAGQEETTTLTAAITGLPEFAQSVQDRSRIPYLNYLPYVGD